MSIVDEIVLPEPQAGAVQPPDDLFDPADYREYLADMQMSEEQERELLGLLWSIMASMVELGFTCDLCGQIFDGFENIPARVEDDVKSSFTEER